MFISCSLAALPALHGRMPLLAVLTGFSITSSTVLEGGACLRTPSRRQNLSHNRIGNFQVGSIQLEFILLFT